MEFSAQQIADLLEGTIEGDANIVVNDVAKIEEGQPKTLSFLANPLYTEHIYTTDASIVIVNSNFKAEKPIKETCTLIRVSDAYKGFSKLLAIYQKAMNDKTGIEQPSFINETAKLGNDIYVGAFAYIGENVTIGANVKIYPQAYIGDNVIIGDNTTIFAGAKVYAGSKIGNYCVINAGAIIGADGFGFAPSEDGNFEKVPQIGNVILEDHVDVGANTCVDKATLGHTIIREGVKLDNLIQVGHNAEIGKNTVIAAQTGIAGSTTIEEQCMIGGQVGIVGHLTIGKGTKIMAQSGVAKNISENSRIQGSPAISIGDYKKSYIQFMRLPNTDKRLTDVEKKLK